MVAIKIRQLIDLAIGFPETGLVNFSALHCVLSCMAEKLGIADETLNYDEIEHEKRRDGSKLSNSQVMKNQTRLIAGEEDYNDNDNDNGNDNDNDNDIGNANEAKFKEQEEGFFTLAFGEEQEVEASEKDYEVIEEEIPEEATETAINMPDVEEGAISKIEGSPRHSKLRAELSTEQPQERMNEFDNLENMTGNVALPEGLITAIAILKHQLHFALDQLLLLTFLTLSKTPDTQQYQQLYSMAQTLNELKKKNIPIKSLKELPTPFRLSLNWFSSNLKLNEEDLAEDVLMEEEQNGSIMAANESAESSSRDSLDGHLCYSPAKLLDQLMNLKSDFCLLTNKVNEISVRLLQQESHQLLALVQEAHKQIRDLKLANVDLKENYTRLDMRITTNQNNIENLKRSLAEILETMVDKTYFEMQLANKVDYNQLQRKASLDQILELQCRIDKKFDEIFKRFSESDKKLLDTAENLKAVLGPTAVDEVLAKFKEDISKEVQQLHEVLRKYVEATNDDCAAAGARVKVLQDLACLSCDAKCVMPVMERAKVAKLPSAHASNIISPLVTYELGSIRKSGIMGYYRKDEFPHAPNAWLAQQSLSARNKKQSSIRHAGGDHTTNSAKERHEKIMLNKK